MRLEDVPAFAHLGKEGQSTTKPKEHVKPAQSTSLDLMTCCAFCPTEKRDLYVCPQCKKPYCSLRCYRSRQHAVCSEKFYENCVREKTGEQVEPPEESAKSFEEYMESQDQGAPEPEGELLDSDDEDLTYLKNVVQETMENFEDMDENEIQRQLTVAGVGGIKESHSEEDEEYQMKLLFENLTMEEKREFQKMVESMTVNEQGLTNSCFGKRMD
ncbi:hypothetical protein L596_023668 [Steinernema carpocapsae]|uniref:HIT-type domain-containing protein n=1 Tax=Steinernema carpocapsae TaxID=34508 RepID=A0A4V5ZZG8_STECR|nr:hypothetical protein L596_023668 [Steinernema carpocapsae]